MPANQRYLLHHTYGKLSPHPGAVYDEKQFSPPSIPSPPPVQQFTGQQTVTGLGFQQQPWQQQQQMTSNSPPLTSPSHGEFNPYQLTGSPSPPPPAVQYPNASINGIAQNGSFQSPSPYFSGIQNPSAMMMSTSKLDALKSSQAPPIDEGKMSVSIDFGMQRQTFVFSKSLLTYLVYALRYYFLRRGKPIGGICGYLNPTNLF